MHAILANEIVKVCRARSAEGDCPITPPESIERLEQCVIELANQLQIFSADEPSIEAYKLFRKERQAREAAEEKLKALQPDEETRHDLPHHQETMDGLQTLTIRKPR